MIKALVSDFSRVLLAPANDAYAGGLNALYKEITVRGAFNFWDHFRLNNDLLAFYGTLRPQIALYLFTSEHIQEDPALQPKISNLFAEVFSGARLGLKKSETESHASIAQRIGLPPNEILYVDDNGVFCQAAARAGMVVVRFESTAQTIADVTALLAS